ncbi:MAG: hypothetical protein K6C94_02410 [Candidatus Gastranaerophilales bacterium]|nr:hypothetical protein [Candidatus Gastranaerophilales bacterium]
MRKILILLFLFFIGLSVYSAEADDSVDEYIKKKFNAEGSSLPKLPSTSPKSIESQNFLDNPKPTINAPVSQKPQTKQNVTNLPSVPQKVNVRTTKLARGKKLHVKFKSNVSSSTQKGTTVSFTTQEPVYTKQITIPAGTKIYGSVVNSHNPQIFGNGGLVAIKADYIEYNGKTAYFEGNIVELNHKKILFNNIKGSNGYTAGVKKVMRPAQTFYNKSLKVTKKLWKSPGCILTPVTYLPGAVFLAGDAVVAPFIAVFHKGNRAYVKAGTTATVKLTSPAYIEY